jgi:hypothetical protein
MEGNINNKLATHRNKKRKQHRTLSTSSEKDDTDLTQNIENCEWTKMSCD